MDRYARQSIFGPIGPHGQAKIAAARITIIGMGALGSVAANNMVRAGVGFVRIIDRDYVELTNLQRQLLYNEADVAAELPKVVAASQHLHAINHEITLDPIIADVNAFNIEGFIKDVDLVLDATDNFTIRHLINEACNKHQVPWIYCAALGAEGMTLNIMQQAGSPCLRCFVGAQHNSGHSCSTFGVINMITNTMASIQTAEALKFLIGEPLRTGLLAVDLWDHQFHQIPLQQNPDCPVCVHHRYEGLEHPHASVTTSLCGTDSIQVMPTPPRSIDFAVLQQGLQPVGDVQVTPFYLKLTVTPYQVTLFQDGRALFKGAKDENHARSLYTEFFGA